MGWAVAIVFRCGCGKKYSVPEAAAGKRARCKSCRALLDIPAFVPTPEPAPVRLYPEAGRRRRGPRSLVLAAGLILAVLGAGWLIAARSPHLPWRTLTAEQSVVRDYFVRYAHDPSSVEFVEWSEPRPTAGTDSHWPGMVAVHFVLRSRNAAGALETVEHLAYVREGRVVFDFIPGHVHWWHEMGALFDVQP
jgi:hypothetical protein